MGKWFNTQSRTKSFPKWPIFTMFETALRFLAWFQYPSTLRKGSGECHQAWLAPWPPRLSAQSFRCIWAQERITGLPPGVMPQTRARAVLWPVIVPAGNHLTSTQVPSFTETPLKSQALSSVCFSVLSQFPELSRESRWHTQNARRAAAVGTS